MKLIFKGVVQGVGFRPTIYRVAKTLGLKGYVLNKGSEVEVVIDRDSNEFINRVKKELPSIAKIDDIVIKEYKKNYKDFQILYSKNGEKQSLIPVDIGICNECLQELFDKKNKRYHFPFINCTVCGARFSIIKNIPYDRERTSMDKFRLCEKCRIEYEDPLNRRYHAQTISCPTCGPEYKLYDKNLKNLGKINCVKQFAKRIDLGEIGVIKSWGGMHICCIPKEISKFRNWYSRPQKSFAIMVRDINIAKKYGEITENEQNLLLSKAKPIILINKKKTDQISPGLNTIGIFLPYTGIHHLLFYFLKSDALIMTSANIPGEPIIIRNKDAFSLNADIYLLHNRKIPNRIDDSVLRLWNGKKFFLRKSRGYVPDPIDVKYNKRVLSVGAGENICGAISCNKKIYMTQYIGNSKYYKNLKFLEKSIFHLLDLTMKKKNIDAVAVDLHPGYNSRKVAKFFSDKFKSPLYEIQHHWAHAASLLVDNDINESVVLTLDGLGYGDDGKFWGGEVLYSTLHSFERIGHLEYIPLLGGDQSTYDPRRLVFAIFNKFNKEKYFKDNEADIFRKMIDKSPQSSSFGRILDALSCYLDICSKRSYDGEPAMKLEKYLAEGKMKYSFDVEIKNGIIGTTDLFRQVDEIKISIDEKQKADISYSMIKSIVDGLTKIAIEHAEKIGIENIGVTGGVSYNIPIIEIIEKNVKKANLKLTVHNRIPNGDGGISVGQNAIVANLFD